MGETKRGVRFMPDQGTMLRMGSINGYILRTTLGAFLIVLVSLTAVIWVTQALRDIDIMTSQGQTILVFVGITGLIIPLLVLVIAPIALLIAVAHVLNKLSNDSEIIVMNPAGMSPWVLFRAFMAAALVVSLLVGAISARRWPACFTSLQLRVLLSRTTPRTGVIVSMNRELTAGFAIGANCVWRNAGQLSSGTILHEGSGDR